MKLEVRISDQNYVCVNIPLLFVLNNGTGDGCNFVSYAVDQNKSEDEKARARNNIGITNEMYENILNFDVDVTLQEEVTSVLKVGGIEEGTTLEASTTFHDFVDKLLNPFQKPLILFSISPSGTREVGEDVSSVGMTAFVTKKTAEIANVIFYKVVNDEWSEIEDSTVSEYTVLADGRRKFEFTYNPSVIISNNVTFGAKVRDAILPPSVVSSNTAGINFKYKVYAEQKVTDSMDYRSSDTDIKAIGRSAYYGTSVSVYDLMGSSSVTIKHGVYIYVPKGFVPSIHTSNNTTPDLYDITATAGYITYNLRNGNTLKYAVWEMRSVDENIDTYSSISFSGSYSN